MQVFPVEAEFHGLARFRFQPGGVADVGEDAVEREDIFRARGQDHAAGGIEQRQPIRPRLGAQVLREVGKARDQSGDAGDGRNRIGLQNCARRFHQHPDGLACCQTNGLGGIGWAIHLRHHQHIDLRSRHRREIRRGPGCAQPVHPDGHFPFAPATCVHSGDSCCPRAVLRVGCDSVFQIDDHRVRRQAARLLDRAGIGAGKVQHRTARAEIMCHRRHSCFLSCPVVPILPGIKGKRASLEGRSWTASSSQSYW
jgi:hypothetical protein